MRPSATRVALAYLDRQAATPGWETMRTLIGEKSYRGLILVRRNLSGATPTSTQTANLLLECLELLAKMLDVDRNTLTAMNKLRNLGDSGDRWDVDTQRNQIFKIADLLGVKLPSGSF